MTMFLLKHVTEIKYKPKERTLTASLFIVLHISVASNYSINVDCKLLHVPASSGRLVLYHRK